MGEVPGTGREFGDVPDLIRHADTSRVSSAIGQYAAQVRAEFGANRLEFPTLGEINERFFGDKPDPEAGDDPEPGDPAPV